MPPIVVTHRDVCNSPAIRSLQGFLMLEETKLVEVRMGLRLPRKEEVKASM